MSSELGMGSKLGMSKKLAQRMEKRNKKEVESECVKRF